MKVKVKSVIFFISIEKQPRNETPVGSGFPVHDARDKQAPNVYVHSLASLLDEVLGR